jgi:Spy/CpxP family protein refolding chaperone
MREESTMRRLVSILFLAVVWSATPPAKANPTEAPPANSADQCLPPAVIASFLGFTEAQAAQFGELLPQLQAALHGLQEQTATLQTQLDILLGQPNPDPAMVGSLFLHIHALQLQVAQTLQAFQHQFASLLTDAQAQKVQAVTQASQLQPVVGAFVALHLVVTPTPLSCEQQ